MPASAPRRRTAATPLAVVVVATAVVIVLVGAGLSGCSAPQHRRTTTGGNGVVAAGGSEPSRPLVPTDTDDTAGRRVIGLLFEPLVVLDADDHRAGGAAASITSPDAQHYAVTLRPGLEFSDGSPVTSASFVDAWTYGATSTSRQRRASAFAGIAGYAALAADPPTATAFSGLTVVDDTHFAIALAAPERDFETQLGDPAFSPLPATSLRDVAASGQAPVGNGPYRLAGADAWQHGVGLDLVRNDRYSGSRRPANGGISFAFSDSSEAAYNELLAGTLDVVDVVPPVAAGSFRHDLGRRALHRNGTSLATLVLPAQLPHFAGVEGRLRRAAVSRAIDRPAIARAALGGDATPARDFTSPALPGWTPTLAGAGVLTRDDARARSLWAQADRVSPWSGRFTIAYPADSGQQMWVDAVARDLHRTLRIDVRGVPYPTQAVLDADVGERIVGGAWTATQRATYPGRASLLAPAYATGGSADDSDYRDGDVDALLARSSSAPTDAGAAALLDRAQEQLLADLPVIPLWYLDAAGGYSSAVSGARFGWDGLVRYDEIAKS